MCVCVAAGSVVVLRTGHPEGLEQQRSRPHSEPIPLKNRMAMYQASVSQQDTPGFSNGVHKLIHMQTQFIIIYCKKYVYELLLISVLAK